MRKYVIEENEKELHLTLSVIGRIRRGLVGFFVVLVLTLGGLILFYAPDYLVDYGKRSVTFRGLFGIYLLSAALLAGLVAGILRSAADYRWTVLKRRGAVRWWSRRPFGQDIEDELDVAHVKSVELDGLGRFGAERRIVLILEEGEPIVVARARVYTGELDALRDTIARSVRRARDPKGNKRSRSRSKG